MNNLTALFIIKIFDIIFILLASFVGFSSLLKVVSFDFEEKPIATNP
jgi:hypothetical protein